MILLSDTQNHILTKYEVTTEPQDHLARSLTQWWTILWIWELTVFRRPRGLHRSAPIKTPGSAMEERRSCHSAIFLMSLSWMTLEMMVPENTPLGKVTKSYKNLNSISM